MKKQDLKTHAQARSPMLERESFRKLQDLEKGHTLARDPALEHTAHIEKTIEDSRTTLERSPSCSSVDAINLTNLLRRIHLLGENLRAYLKGFGHRFEHVFSHLATLSLGKNLGSIGGED